MMCKMKGGIQVCNYMALAAVTGDDAVRIIRLGACPTDGAIARASSESKSAA
jgi:hypothetical protein